MARKKVEEAPRSGGLATPPQRLDETSSVTRAVPLVFISHDSRDADLAEAFDHLLTDASGGVVQTFRSSDQSGRAGIDYGENWFSKITTTLSDATDVVALLTPNSVGRPWILFEAGFAVGRLDAKVFGIALGIPLSKAVTGPFAQFQNCEANEESLTTVVLKLIQRNPDERPREQAVRKQVSAFLDEIAPLLTQRSGSQKETQEDMDATAVAKLFEEVKVMFRDLPSRVQSELRDNSPTRKRRRFHPMMIDDIIHASLAEEADPSLTWLLLASLLREDQPLVSDAAMEIYRALQNDDPISAERAYLNMQAMLRLMRNSKAFHRFDRSDEDSFMLLRHLPEMLERAIGIGLGQKKGRRGKPEMQAVSSPEPEQEKR
ncbi:MAG: toll/interleukin-1 receptor domain-containing protein [Thermoanaerobaculia bacterium]